MAGSQLGRAATAEKLMPNLLLLFRAAPWVIILALTAWSLRLNDLRDRYQHLWHAEQSGRAADRSAYQTAQRQAQLENEKHVEQENRLRKEITDANRSTYLAERDRLRREANGTPQSPASPTQAAGVPDPAQGADGENVCVSRSLLLQAKELELSRNYLIDWLNGQATLGSVP